MRQTEIQLSQLRHGHHPDAPAGVVNVRVIGRDVGLEALAASILAHGLLQPLVVVPGPDDFHYVVDGNRRHAALESLLAAGEIEAAYKVPVIERNAETAREVGLAANMTQAPMHEADKVRCFCDLREACVSVKAIAKDFGMSVAEVKRLQALGGLSPAVLDAWRDGKLRREDVQHFTLADHVKQERALEKVLRDGGTWRIREYLGLTDDVAHLLDYVGAKAYRSAGGNVVEDLFGSRDAVSDVALLRRLADERLEAECERRRREGWAWVARDSDLPPGWQWGWARLKAGTRMPTEAEQARVAELYASTDHEGVTGEEIVASTREITAITEGCRVPLGAQDRAVSGCVVALGRDGKVAVTEYVVRPHDAPEKKSAPTAAKAAEPEEKALPMSLVEALCTTATEAVQATLGSSPTAGLVALLAGAVCRNHWAAPMKVRLDGLGGQHATLHDEAEFPDLVARLSAMSVDELLEFAAGVASRGVQTLHRDPRSRSLPPSKRPAVQALMGLPDPATLEVELRARFDGEGFFKSAPKGATVGIVAEVLGEAEGRRAAGMKKSDLVALAVGSVLPTGWLPAEIRHPGYAGPGASVAPTEVQTAA